MTRTILITGSSGNIGGKLAVHFARTGGYDLRLLDLKPAPGTITADLGTYDDSWASAFAGVDTVIHMAANPSGAASWASVLHANVAGTQNVLRAARDHKVRRVILASSVQVMLGHRFEDGPITTEMPPAPMSPYGISKLFGEELGRGFARETGISTIVFRIGYFQRGENLPGPWMKIGALGQSMWLSNRDMNQAMERAVEAEDVPFAVLNLISNNPGTRWDLSETRRVIGYAPQDGHVTVTTPELEAEDAEARRTRIAPGTWVNEYLTPVKG